MSGGVEEGRVLTAQGVVTLGPVNEVPEHDLVLCESPDGWSLHAPGATDQDIAHGDSPPLACGEGAPTEADYEAARQALRAQMTDERVSGQ